MWAACVLACCLPILLVGAGISATAMLAGMGTVALAIGGITLAAAGLRARRHR